MKNSTKILWILVFFALIGISINAQPVKPVKLAGSETSHVKEIVNNYIISQLG